MIHLKKILVPYDYSSFSEKALQYGLTFAETYEAELHLLHVHADPGLALADPEMSMVPVQEMMREEREWATKKLEEIPSLEWREKLQVVRVVREGVPYLEIVRYADAEEVDLIILGTHGRTGFSRLLLGSVAEKVVRQSPCPVLTVHNPEHEFIDQ